MAKSKRPLKMKVIVREYTKEQIERDTKERKKERARLLAAGVNSTEGFTFDSATGKYVSIGEND